jgi:Pentapeptide repeats (8 copies)
MWILALDPARIPVVLRAYGVRVPTEALLSLFVRPHPKPKVQFRRRLYVLAIMAHFLLVAPLFGFAISFAFWHVIRDGAPWPWPERLRACLVLGIEAGTIGGGIVGAFVFMLRRRADRKDAWYALLSGLILGFMSGVLTGIMVAVGLGPNSKFTSRVPLWRLLVGGGIVGFGISSVFALSLSAFTHIAKYTIRLRHALLVTLPLAFAIGLWLANQPDWRILAAATGAVFIGIGLTMTRILPFYPVFFVWQSLAYGWQRLTRRPCISLTPARLSPFSYFRYPFLCSQICDTVAKGAPEEALRVIRLTLKSRGLKRQAATALAILQASEISELVKVPDFGALGRRSTFWLRLSTIRFGNTTIHRKFQFIAACIHRAEKEEHPKCLVTLGRADRHLAKLDGLTQRIGPQNEYRAPLHALKDELVRRKQQCSRALTTAVIEAQTALTATSRTKWVLPLAHAETAMATVVLLLLVSFVGISALVLRGIQDPDKRASTGVSLALSLSTFIALGVSAYFSYRSAQSTKETVHLARDKQYTDRFNEAIKHIGDENQGVRQGAIIALDRLGFDSDRDYGLVSELLAGHVRRQCRPSRHGPHLDLGASPPAIEEDVEAALVSLCQRREAPPRERPPRIDLSECELSGVSIPGARLAEATLRNIKVSDSNLIYADLRRADLAGADLRNAQLIGADLRGANLSGADLTGADTRLADLRGTNQSGAKITALSGLAVR